jgi:ABC-type antimicrobial peptide transport system permease subunit
MSGRATEGDEKPARWGGRPRPRRIPRSGPAMAGVYGAMAYAVGQRSNEIGLRIALGASRGSVLRLILGESLALVGVGLALGLSAAVAVTRLLAAMLFQVRPNDPLVYIGVAVLLGVVTLFAAYVPATRAGGIDPLTALRQE